MKYADLKDFDKEIEQKLGNKTAQTPGQPSPLIERLRQIAAARKPDVLKRPL